MFVLAEFLFDFPFKNFSLFWPLFWEPFEARSSTFLATQLRYEASLSIYITETFLCLFQTYYLRGSIYKIEEILRLAPSVLLSSRMRESETALISSAVVRHLLCGRFEEKFFHAAKESRNYTKTMRVNSLVFFSFLSWFTYFTCLM